MKISAWLLTYGKEKDNLNKKHEVCVKIYEHFVFILYSFFQYVNNSWAEISPVNRPSSGHDID